MFLPELYLIRLQLTTSAGTSYLICKSNLTSLHPQLQLTFKNSRTYIEEYTQNFTITLNTVDQNITKNIKLALSNTGFTVKRGKQYPVRGSNMLATPYFQIRDASWFSGSVFQLDFDCNDCKSRIFFKNKITLQQKYKIDIQTNYFWYDQQNSVRSLSNNYLLTFKNNFKPWPIQPFSQENNYGLSLLRPLALGSNSNCLNSVAYGVELVVSLCRRNTFLKLQYFVTLMTTGSFKSFIISETVLAFEGQEQQPKMIVKQGIVIVYSNYKLSMLVGWQIDGQYRLIQIQDIDSNEMLGTITAVDLFSNMTQHNYQRNYEGKLFGIGIGLPDSSFYYRSFYIYAEKQQIVEQSGKISYLIVPNIHVLYSQKINLKALLLKKKIIIPSDATIIQVIYKKQSIIQTFILSLFTIYDKFNTYQYTIEVNPNNGIVGSLILKSIFFKYGVYQAVSAQLQEYLVIKNQLNIGFGKLDEIYMFYDLTTFVYTADLIREYHIFSSYSLKKYRKNSQQNKEIPWTMKGHNIIYIRQGFLQKLNITNVIRGFIKNLQKDNPQQPYQTLYTQNLVITASNPGSARSATIAILAYDIFVLSGWQITIIVAGSTAVLLLLFFSGRWIYRRYEAKRKQMPLGQAIVAEDGSLQYEQQQRISQDWRINASVRGSTQTQF